MSPRFTNINRPLPGPTTGEAIGTGVALVLGVIVLVIVGTTVAMLFSVKAKAHEAGKGWEYPWECCHNTDCTQISADRVKPEAGGYLVDGQFHVAQKDVRDSPDGEYHACFPKPDFLRCFWAPPAGS